MGTPLSIAVRLLPTPVAGDSAGCQEPELGGTRASGAKRQMHLRSVIAHQLFAERCVAGTPPSQAGRTAGRLLPTPDTGTSPAGHGRRGGRPGNGHQSGQDLDAVTRALRSSPTADARPPAGPGQPDGQQAHARGAGVDWGPYEAAVRRWEHTLGCPAPPPAEPGPGQRLRLAAGFAEWLMGIPGWVTGVTGLPRTAQLRVIGNGVVPQQGAMALRLLIDIAAPSPSEPDLAGSASLEAAA